MEGHESERQATPEADYLFDPISATPEEWRTYLLNPLNFDKDFVKSEYPFVIPAQEILDKVHEVHSPRLIVETAVQVILENWDEIISQNQKSLLSETNPIKFVIELASESSIDVVQRLWNEAPQDSIHLQEGLRDVVGGLGLNVPLNQEGLERLYTEQFDKYSFTALEIMLLRGEVERATKLFEEHISQYPKGHDPVMLDYVVRLGLTASTAKKWLDQSISAGKGYEAFYREALERWGYKD